MDCSKIRSLFSILLFCFTANVGFAQNNAEAPKEEIFTIVEQMPQFSGGNEAMFSFIRENIKYSKKELKKGSSNVIYVTFEVDKNGEIVNPKILKNASESEKLAQEAIRVVKMMPKWEPGKQNGRAVNVQYNLPIKFT